MRGRRPAGPAYVDKLEGSVQTKERLKVILQTMRGDLTVLEACAQLGVSTQRFHQLREEAMQGALQALEPRPAGRPSRPPTPAEEQVEQLQKELAHKEFAVRAAQVREEIALVLPRVVQPAEPAEKKKKTRRRR
jgi:hypothetical protein